MGKFHGDMTHPTPVCGKRHYPFRQNSGRRGIVFGKIDGFGNFNICFGENLAGQSAAAAPIRSPRDRRSSRATLEETKSGRSFRRSSAIRPDPFWPRRWPAPILRIGQCKPGHTDFLSMITGGIGYVPNLAVRKQLTALYHQRNFQCRVSSAFPPPGPNRFSPVVVGRKRPIRVRFVVKFSMGVSKSRISW